MRTAPGELLDAVSFSFPLATAIGRVGCLLNGCCFGVAAAPRLPHALTVRAADYVPPSLAAAFYAGADPALRVVNLPLLFILAELVVLVVVETLYRRRVGRPGFVFGVAVGLDALLRVGVETFRADGELGRSPWQAMALGIAVVGLTFAASRLQSRAGQARQRP